MLLKIFFMDSVVSLKPPKLLPGLIETAEAASAVSLRPLKQISSDYLEFLIEAICKTALACESGP
jgi:hypothetical protein